LLKKNYAELNTTVLTALLLKRKYGPESNASYVVLFVNENNKQGRTKMIEDGIMDKR
jgi:hypothetical protein